MLQAFESRATTTAYAHHSRAKLPQKWLTADRQVTAHVGDVELLLLALIAGCVAHVVGVLQLDLAAP